MVIIFTPGSWGPLDFGIQYGGRSLVYVKTLVYRSLSLDIGRLYSLYMMH